MGERKPTREKVAAVVLAAGLSRRMGRPKMILPWGGTTVIGQVVSVLTQAGVENVVVITGGVRRQVESALCGLPVRSVFNPRFEEDHMVLSLQIGLSDLDRDVDAALVVLGDQPQVQASIVQAVIREYREGQKPIVVPSHANRRGHPWLVDRSLWKQLMVLTPPYTLRDFLVSNEHQIYYLAVGDDSVLRDIDTPSDYQKEHMNLQEFKKREIL